MITFGQARQIAHARVGPTWAQGDCGEYVVADYGYEDETAWLLVDGSSRLFTDGDDGCEPIGGGCIFVDKITGKVFFRTYLVRPLPGLTEGLISAFETSGGGLTFSV